MASGLSTVEKRKKVTITYKGVFHFKNLYKFLKEWLDAYNFKSDSGGATWEAFYWERRSATGHTDYNIWWRLKKHPDEQPSSWIEYKLNIDFIGIAIEKTDTMLNGKKTGAYKGELNINITPVILIDKQKLWDDSTILGKFTKSFLKRTYKKEIKYHKDQLDDVIFQLQEAVKHFLGLSTFGNYGEGFHPTKGLGWA
jgi:hypothetical protein